MQTPPDSKSSDSGCGGLMLRLFWMAWGNIVLVTLAVFIVEDRLLPYHLIDLLYLATVVLLIVARYLDVSFFHGDTSNGEPATMKHWRQYAVRLISIALAMWGAAYGGKYLW